MEQNFCPKCGCPLKDGKCTYCGWTPEKALEETNKVEKKKSKKKTFIIIGGIIILLAISSIVNSCNDARREAKYAQEEKEQEVAEKKEAEEEAKMNLDWPEIGIATMLPAPSETKGIISNDSATCFTSRVYNMDQTKFNDYVKACQEKGFIVDYDKGDDYYKATNDSECELYIRFEKEYKRIFIRLDVPEEKVEEVKKEENKSEEDSANVSETTSVKEVMDEYEKFVDEYVAFMKKYNNASASDVVSMSVDYGKLLVKYEKWSQKVEALDSSSMSNDDLNYYTTVMNRCNQKLAGI